MDFITSLFTRGGPLMWPLLLCSIVAVTIIIERFVFWWRWDWNREDEAVERLFEATEKGNPEEARHVATVSADHLVQVLGYGLAHRDHGLTEAIEVRAADEIERMKNGLLILDTIITMAPLLGIMGTVTGIIDAFELLGASDLLDPRAVSGGIAEALITTAAGLAVALPTLVFFNYFTGRVQREAGRLEKTATRFEVAYRKGSCQPT